MATVILLWHTLRSVIKDWLLRLNEIKMCAALGCQSEREVKSIWTAVVINVLIATRNVFVYLLYVI